MRAHFVTLDEAVVLLRDKVEMLIVSESNEARKNKLQTLKYDLIYNRYEERDLKLIHLYWPGVMLSSVEEIYDKVADLRGLMILELVGAAALVEAYEEVLAENIEDSE